jgi:aminoglycoside phosphotransferase (APT) family kinase protein
MDAGMRGAVAEWLQTQTDAEKVEITGAKLLSGGAIQENWLLYLTIAGGRLSGLEQAVLRTDAASGVDESRGRVEEFHLLSAGFEAGMTAPEPLALEPDASVTGKPFYIMRKAAGTANPRLLTRDAALEPYRTGLTRQIGMEMARLHSIRPPRKDLDFLGDAPANPAARRISELLSFLDGLPKAYPALEWGLRWLEVNRPTPGPAVLCHRDFRTGNYMVADGTLTGVLDWEFAGWSDPLEDIGWFCARCWRFGANAREAGGIGSREHLYEGYEEEAGSALNWSLVPYWEVLAIIRWGVIALLQGERYNSDAGRSIELALTGRKAAEMEFDMLQQIAELERGRANV